MDIKKFASDTKSEEQGVWVPLDESTKLLIARTNNPRFQKALRRELKPHRQAIRMNALSDGIAEKVMNKVLADTILLGWEGMTENGKAMVYSKEAAEELFGRPHLKDFRQFVIDSSENQELFRLQEIEADVSAGKQ